jgi:hypothetical protein
MGSISCELIKILTYLSVHLTIIKQGSHFMKCGVEGLGSELQQRGISRFSRWGAQGIV